MAAEDQFEIKSQRLRSKLSKMMRILKVIKSTSCFFQVYSYFFLGWEEQAKVPEVKQEKDKLSMVVIDASASSESLPQRTHHVVDNSASTNATNSKPTSQPASRGGATAGRGAPVRRGTGAPRGNFLIP